MGERLPVHSKLTAFDGTSAVDGAGPREVEEGQISYTESVEVLYGLPHLARLQGMIGGHFLREASSLRDQQTDILDEVGLRLVLCGLFPSGQNFPIPAFSNPVLLVLAQRFVL